MSTCPNCKKKLSCGCQKRKASNGREVCSNCLTSYEATFNNKSENLTGTTSATEIRDSSPKSPLVNVCVCDCVGV